MENVGKEGLAKWLYLFGAQEAGGIPDDAVHHRSTAAGQVDQHIQIQVIMVRDVLLVLGQGLEHHESGLEPMREKEGDLGD